MIQKCAISIVTLIFQPLTQQAILSRLNYSSRIDIKGQLHNANDPTSASLPFEFLDEIIVKRWHSHLLIHYISTHQSLVCIPRACATTVSALGYKRAVC